MTDATVKYVRIVDPGCDPPPPPHRGSEGASGWDLRAYAIAGCFHPLPNRELDEDPASSMECAIEPGMSVTFRTGLRFEIPPRFEGQVRPRSGMARRGLTATLGTIDSDYRGEVLVHLTNTGMDVAVVDLLERIAQLVIVPVPEVAMVEVDPGDLSATERGTRGFGSTGRL